MKNNMKDGGLGGGRAMFSWAAPPRAKTVVRSRPRAGRPIAAHPSALDDDYWGADVQVVDSTVYLAGTLTPATYEALLLAIESVPDDDVTLEIDSPGGYLDGLFECMQRLLALDKTITTRVSGGMCCSAAYGLASATSRIVCSEWAEIGSIGVLIETASYKRNAEMVGVDPVVVTSGSKKAPNHPMRPADETFIAAAQSSVDELAGIFVGMVAANRGAKSEDIMALEGDTFLGNKALALGLVDEVIGEHMTKKEKALSALRALAAEGDKQAKLALAALASTEEETAVAEEEEASTEEDNEQASAEEEGEEEEASEEEEEEASAEEDDNDNDMAAALAKLQRQLKATRDQIRKDKVAALLQASKATAAQKKLLADKPVAEVEAFLATLAPNAGAVDTAAGAQATRGGQPAAGMSFNQALNERMGLKKKTRTVTFDEKTNIQQFGVMK